MHLQRVFSGFPAGWAGFALLVLRVAVGAPAAFDAVSIIVGSQTDPDIVVTIIALSATIASVAVIVGYLTPFACALVCVECIVALFAHPAVDGLRLLESQMASMQFVVMSAALIALGPGAASIDARTFGRRQIPIRGTQHRDDS